MTKNKALYYRIIYGICFLLLMVIDWSRGSQRGVVWEMTVNLTGVVIAFVLFSWTEIKRFLHPVYIIWGVFGGVAVPGSILWWQSHQSLIYRDKLWSAVLSVWLLGFISIYLVIYWKPKPLLKQLLSEKENIVLYVMLFWMFLSLNEDVWPIWYLWMVLLIVAMPKEEWMVKALSKGLIDGLMASFFVLQGLAFVFRPFDALDSRYVGMYANTNMNALFYNIVLMAFLVRLYEVQKNQKSTWQYILLFLFVAVVWGFLCLTVCRTGLMTALLLLAVYVISVDFCLLRKKATQVITIMFAFVLCCIVALPITYSAARFIPPLFHHPIWFDGEYSEDKIHSWDSIDSDKYVSFEEVLRQLHIRTGAMQSRALELFVDEPEEETNYKPGGITLGKRFYEYNSAELSKHESAIARLSIWEHYIKNGTLWGHSNKWGHRTGMYGITWHGQNAFVQFWFYYGIPAAVLYLAWIIITFIKGINLSKNGHDEGLILVLATVVVFAFGIFEAVWYPAQMSLFLFIFIKVVLSTSIKGNHNGCIKETKLYS